MVWVAIIIAVVLLQFTEGEQTIEGRCGTVSYSHSVCHITCTCVCCSQLSQYIILVCVCKCFSCSSPPSVRRQRWGGWGGRMAGEFIYTMCYLACCMLSCCQSGYCMAGSIGRVLMGGSVDEWEDHQIQMFQCRIHYQSTICWEGGMRQNNSSDQRWLQWSV